MAIGALSPLGLDDDAVDVVRLGEPARVAIRRDEAMAHAGFARPVCARVSEAALSEPSHPASPLPGFNPVGGVEVTSGDRACRLLDRVTDLALTKLVSVRPSSTRSKIGLLLGTSSGGMCTAEELFARRARGERVSPGIASGATYFAPFVRARSRIEARGFVVARSLNVVTACAASTWALGVGLMWLESGDVDVVLAGGFDALCTFVASGFESLRATSSTLPAPFRAGRDGMALGEGAALVALVREGEERGAPVRFFVSGFGASTDAVHITAPDRTGGGLARAANAALRDAGVGPEECGLVSVHGTSTPYNDAMEARALATVFGDREPIVHPFKAQIGHTLGAAGVLETLALARAIEARIAPASAGDGDLDPDARARVLTNAEPLVSDAGLKLSAAFGGANAALVIERSTTPARPRARPRRAVYLKGFERAKSADPQLIASASGEPLDKINRADAVSLQLATAIAKLGRTRVQGAGVIVGHFLATIDLNERFYGRVFSRGPTAAEPRLFPPTSPNLMPGQVAIYFGLTGPSAAVASGPGAALDPLVLATDLIARGDADKMLATAVDVLGPTSSFLLEQAFQDARGVTTGAVAALLDADPTDAIADLSELGSGDGEGHASLADALASLASRA